MKEVSVKIIDHADVDPFLQLGLSPDEAYVLVALGATGEATQDDLTRSTARAQSDLSDGLKALQARGWVRATPIVGRHRGRPRSTYRLTKPLSEIAEGMVAEAEKRYTELRQVVERMRAEA